MNKQPIRDKHKNISKLLKNKSEIKKSTKKSHHHKQEYGMSKLEDKFAHDFLDKLGIKYIRQFKAESIERYYDFYLPDSHILIEIDGDYW